MEAFSFYILLLGLAWYIISTYLIPRIKNLPPTPLSAFTIIGYLIFFKQPMHRTLSKIATRHGPILLLRFGCRRVLLISSASAAEQLFTDNDVVFANRPKMVQGKEFGHNYSDLPWVAHGDHCRHLRCVSFLEILPLHGQPCQLDCLIDEVKLLLRQLYRKEKEIVDLKPMLLSHVFNVMMRKFAGKRYWQKKRTTKLQGKETVSISLLEYATLSFKLTTAEPDMGYFMPIVKSLGLTTLEQRCKELQTKGDSLMETIIEEIRNGTSELSDGSYPKEESVIQSLLDKQKDDPKNYRDEIIIGLLLVLLSAGTGTSAGTMEWALSLLLNHPEIMLKAQNEIDNFVGNDRFLEPSDIKNLPYLTSIVKETLRLYPAAPLLVPHESSEECKVGGYKVPKGTMLLVNVWAIQHDPTVWKEPTRFMPERFEEIVTERDAYNLMPFGNGSRSCPGKNMAVNVITLTLGSLIQCFDWERVDEKMVDMSEQLDLALMKDKPLRAKCLPRSVMANLLGQI